MSSVVASVREAPLCQLDWELHICGEGMVQEVPELLAKVFKGGIDENIRGEVWKYLLGYYHWHHPHQVRETNRKARVEEYFRMKLQWKSRTYLHLLTCTTTYHLLTCTHVTCSPAHLPVTGCHLLPVHLPTRSTGHLSTWSPVHLSTCPPAHLST